MIGRLAGRRALAIGLALAAMVMQVQWARAAEADPWFGHDKLLHFEASSSLAVVGYAGAALATEDRPTRVTAALALSLGAGVGKELWDLAGHGDPSWRDLTWDVVGATAGVLVASAVDWILHRPSARTAAASGAAR